MRLYTHLEHSATAGRLRCSMWRLWGVVQDAIVRAEIAERETMALHDKVAALTQQLASRDGASCGSSEDEKAERRFSSGAAVAADDTALRPPSRWLLSAQTASDAAGPGSTALLTDDAARGSAALLSRESMDAKSLKSDGLMGDEVEGLMSGATAAARGGGRMSALMTQPAPVAQSSGSSSPSKASKDSPGKGKDMLRSCAPSTHPLIVQFAVHVSPTPPLPHLLRLHLYAFASPAPVEYPSCRCQGFNRGRLVYCIFMRLQGAAGAGR